jgi:hypothetical protein
MTPYRIYVRMSVLESIEHGRNVGPTRRALCLGLASAVRLFFQRFLFFVMNVISRVTQHT